MMCISFTIIVIVVFIAAIIVFLSVITYNSLVAKKNQACNAFAGIDTLLKKRYDLIPNLVACVDKYMEHEKNTLTEITNMRAKAVSGQIPDNEKISLDNRMSKMLGAIMVAVENYPDLKTNQNFIQLQAALNEIEEQISAARRAYNASVTDYNNSIEMFPANILASVINYKQKNLFEINEIERQNVNVKNLFNKSSSNT